MIFSGEHWWGGLAVFLSFATINLLVFNYLCRKRRAAEIIVRIISLYLFCYKSWEYGGRSVPVDFSAVSYFLLAIAAWIPFRQFKSFAAFCGFLSGFLYNVAFIFFPETFYANAPKMPVFVIATINHTLLYVGSLLTFSLIKLQKDDLALLPVGAGTVVGYAYLMRFLDSSLTGVSIFDIAEGKIINYVLPSLRLTAGVLAVYYLVCLATLFACVVAVRYINGRLCPKSPFLARPRYCNNMV